MIPSHAHLIWFGPDMPFAYALAVRSAAVSGRFERVTLHHDHDLSHNEVVWRHLTETPGFESRRLDRGVLPLTGELATPLQRLYSVLEKPAARANLWRAALLFQEGGVYLDTDTLTIRDMTPIAVSEAFCGVEPVALLATCGRFHRCIGPTRGSKWPGETCVGGCLVDGAHLGVSRGGTPPPPTTPWLARRLAVSLWGDCWRGCSRCRRSVS